MSATEHQFRGVAFGGFNRQDVLTYVEAAISEHGRQMELLQQELKRGAEARAEQAAALSEAQTREAQSVKEKERLSIELSAAQSQLAEKSAALANAERELALLREQVKTMGPDAEAYVHIKDRAATIELEAHLRAQAILDEGEAQAKASRVRAEEWLRKVQAGYDRLRTDVDATVSHASGELERIQKLLGGIMDGFAVHDEAWEALLNACAAETPRKAPEPIPVEGE